MIEAASSEWPNSEERSVLPIPPAITAEMAKGFTLYMVKAVISGARRRSRRSRKNKPLAQREIGHENHSYLAPSPTIAATLSFFNASV